MAPELPKPAFTQSHIFVVGIANYRYIAGSRRVKPRDK